MKERLTLKRLKEILASRGFTVVLQEDGSTLLRGKRGEATPALMRALGHWKEELIAELKRGQLRKDSVQTPQSSVAPRK